MTLVVTVCVELAEGDTLLASLLEHTISYPLPVGELVVRLEDEPVLEVPVTHKQMLSIVKTNAICIKN